MKRPLIILVSILLILFILGESAVSQSESAKQSQRFTHSFLNPIIEKLGLGSVTWQQARKIAHAAEYFLLSIAALIFWQGKVIRTTYTGFTIAFLDESLQVVTGRGARVKDIWIDLIGVAIGTGVGYLLWHLRKGRRK